MLGSTAARDLQISTVNIPWNLGPPVASMASLMESPPKA